MQQPSALAFHFGNGRSWQFGQCLLQATCTSNLSPANLPTPVSSKYQNRNQEKRPHNSGYRLSYPLRHTHIRYSLFLQQPVPSHDDSIASKTLVSVFVKEVSLIPVS